LAVSQYGNYSLRASVFSSEFEKINFYRVCLFSYRFITLKTRANPCTLLSREKKEKEKERKKKEERFRGFQEEAREE